WCSTYPTGSNHPSTHEGWFEPVGYVEHHGPVAPAAVVVLVLLGHFVRGRERADLLGELAQRCFERRLAFIDRPTRDRPRATAMAMQRPQGEEVGDVVAFGVAQQHAGGTEAAPAGRPVGQGYESVTRPSHASEAT